MIALVHLIPLLMLVCPGGNEHQALKRILRRFSEKLQHQLSHKLTYVTPNLRKLPQGFG